MTTATGFASLNAGLLARKGEAAPALSQDTKMLADAGMLGFGFVGKQSSPEEFVSADGAPEAEVIPFTDKKLASDRLPPRNERGARLKSVSSNLHGPNKQATLGQSAAVAIGSGSQPVGPDGVEPATAASMQDNTSDGQVSESARVSFRMPLDIFLRLKLAGALFERPCRDLLLDALRCHLDRQGIHDFSACKCFRENNR